MKTPAASAHISVLDSLRGFAALSVVLFHFSGASLPKLSNEIIAGIFSWGWTGVDVFFVISGFIIPYIMRQSGYQVKDFPAFLGKRFIRISPPAYAVMLLMVVSYFLIDRFGFSKSSWIAGLSGMQVIHNLAFTIPFTNYLWINDVFWTLAVEFQYYIFVALVYPLMFRNIAWFSAAVVILSLCYLFRVGEYVHFFHHSSIFLMGGLAFIFINKQVSKNIFLLFLMLLTLVAYAQLGIMAAIFGCATALAIAFLQIKNKIGSFFGDISYSLYLTHIFSGFVLEGVLIRVFHPETIFSRMLLMTACFLGAILFAWIFKNAIEVYFIKLSQRAYKKSPMSVNNVVPKSVTL